MAIQKPFNLNQWVEENRDLLKPPVANKNLYKDKKSTKSTKSDVVFLYNIFCFNLRYLYTLYH